jgi:serine/threonine protein kinase
MTSSNVAPTEYAATQILRKSADFSPPVVPQAGRSWASLPIFATLGEASTALLREAMEPVTFLPGAELMRQGAMGHEMFVLDEGAVRVLVRNDEGAVTFERTVKAPAILGEMALVTQELRSATVQAVTEVRALRVNQTTLDDLCAKNPQAARFLTTLVGERLLESKGIRKVGKYEVLGRLGSGGVATVFEAMHPALGIPVALKMLSHAMVFDPSFAEHFGREGRMVAQLNHENIVRVLDTEQAYGTHFIVMEKLTGTLLEDVVDRGERLEWSLVRRILVEIAGALAYSHQQGLIHRDIKPSNAFLTNEKRVKLLDFGIAVHAGSSADSDGKVIGTPYYMSPEQIMGQQLDGRSDLYSLGIMAYELCTHELPFVTDTVQGLFGMHMTVDVPDPRLVEPEIPEDLLEFIRIATAKRREDRFASCQEAADFLKRAGDAAVPETMEMSSLALTYLPSRRADVQRILLDTAEKLRKLRGVSLFQAHQVPDSVTPMIPPPPPFPPPAP